MNETTDVKFFGEDNLYLVGYLCLLQSRVYHICCFQITCYVTRNDVQYYALHCLKGESIIATRRILRKDNDS
jgi:hypothetical protein